MRVLVALVAAAVLAPHALARAQQQQDRLPRPVKLYSVEGRVSLPDDRPATRARVKISNQTDITREAVTNDNGRFEFADLPPGVYYLSATSLADSALASEQVEADTTRTALSVLNINLFLREPGGAAVPQPSGPTVISLAEVGQKVPKDAQKAFRQGIKLKNERRLDDAGSEISRAIELYPEYFQALTERGDIYVQQRRLKDAAEDFARALKVNPRYASALRGAGYCKLEGGEFAEAVRYLEQSASLDPSNASTYLLAGIANLELGRRQAARDALQQALKIDPVRAVRAHIYLANLLAREGHYKEAADELHLYVEAAPSAPDAAEMSRVEERWRERAGAKKEN
jgi:tetratricopeptide (TPR) repeat protein